MKYTALIAEKGYSVAISDEKGMTVGWLTGFDETEIAADFVTMINGGKSTSGFPVEELEADGDVEYDDDHAWWFVQISIVQKFICEVTGMDYGDALVFAEALVKQIKESNHE